MADAPEPWFRNAKTGTETRGHHVGQIYKLTQDYIIYSQREDKAILCFDFYPTAEETRRLKPVATKLNKLQARLLKEADAASYLPLVANAYTNAFEQNIPEARSIIRDINKQIDTNNMNKESKTPYIITALICFAIAVVCLYLYLTYSTDKSGSISEQYYYIILVVFALACGILLHGVAKATGKLSGKILGIEFSLAGAAAIAGLIVIGGFYLPKGKPETTGQTKQFTIRVLDEDKIPVKQGEIKLYTDETNTLSQQIDNNGQVIFSGLPAKIADEKIKLSVTSAGYSQLVIDTVIQKFATIELILSKNGSILLLGKVRDASEVPVSNAVVKINNSTDSSITTTDGTYYLKLKGYKAEDFITLLVTKKDYEAKTIPLTLNGQSQTLDISLKSAAKDPDGVTPEQPFKEFTLTAGQQHVMNDLRITLTMPVQRIGPGNTVKIRTWRTIARPTSDTAMLDPSGSQPGVEIQVMKINGITPISITDVGQFKFVLSNPVTAGKFISSLQVQMFKN
ncbi:hypothetical protein BH11BAC4_BH11BAC4_06650 [soil metagenome]